MIICGTNGSKSVGINTHHSLQIIPYLWAGEDNVNIVFFVHYYLVPEMVNCSAMKHGKICYILETKYLNISTFPDWKDFRHGEKCIPYEAKSSHKVG